MTDMQQHDLHSDASNKIKQRPLINEYKNNKN